MVGGSLVWTRPNRSSVRRRTKTFPGSSWHTLSIRSLSTRSKRPASRTLLPGEERIITLLRQVTRPCSFRARFPRAASPCRSAVSSVP